MDQSFIDLVKRLSFDRVARWITAFGFAAILAALNQELMGVLWLITYGLHEAISASFTRKVAHHGQKQDGLAVLYCANLALGGLIWGTGALLQALTGGVGAIVIAIGILAASLFRGISTTISYLPAFWATTLPLIFALIGLPACLVYQGALDDATWLQVNLASGFVVMSALIGAFRAWQREKRRAQTVQQISLASDAKSQFLATMSHEIRTPLNSIVGIADVLYKTELSPVQREMVNLVRLSGQSLDHLVTEILDNATLDADPISLVDAPFELGETLESAIQQLRHQAYEKHLGFGIDIAPAAKGHYLGDAGRIGQIITILTSNAIKFTDHGRVDLYLDAIPIDGQNVELSITITDTGVGFDPKSSPNLFSGIVPATRAIDHRFGPSARSLYICKTLCELMNGSLSATSQVGAGSRFEARVQVKQSQAFRGFIEQPAPMMIDDLSFLDDVEETAPSGLKILIAEDNPINQKVLAFMLEPMGMIPVIVANGREALDQFKADKFDLVLMDMMMPEMDGLMATREIRAWEQSQKLPRTPIAMLSANAMPDHVTAALEAGCDVHIAKPVTPSALVLGMTEALFTDEETEEETTLRLAS
jgi:signal transduction histidine kinase/CheY-like chemotaxis protein